MNRSLIILVVALLVGLGAVAQAQTVGGAGGSPAVGAQAASPKVDGRFALYREALDRWGPKAPFFGPRGLPDDVDRATAPASLRFVRDLSKEEIEAYEQALGIRFARSQGRVRHLAQVYPVRLPWEALEALSRDPRLVRAELSWYPELRRPLERITEDLGTRGINQRTDGAAGQGQLLATVDSPVDVLHPHLFFADGGHYAWVDKNNDGVFSLGIDGVDLDGSGALEPGEQAVVLDGAYVDRIQQQWQGIDGSLDPRLDWIYLDSNQDGVRNAGRAEGFSEATPAYGEPLFVVDDVDGDGKLDPEERLVRLKTSKVRQVMVGRQLYARGDLGGRGIIDVPWDYGEVDASHGTGVASILLGGQAGYHDRVGLAPLAELANYTWGDGPENEAELFVMDAVEQGASLVVHEWSLIVGQIGDGSTNLERVMEAALQQDVVQVCPAGNLNIADKHVEALVPSNGRLSLGFHVGAGLDLGFGFTPYDFIQGHIIWEGSRAPQISVALPGQEPIALEVGGESFVQLTPEVFGALARGLDGDGRSFYILYLSAAQGGESLPQGDWALVVEGLSSGSRVVSRIGDAYSGWSPGVLWSRPTADQGTLTYPSTSDASLGVAAYGGRHEFTGFGTGGVGELRSYSGRGPRIDGARAIDIAGPDDPYAALAIPPSQRLDFATVAPFSTFGGTSGAGPHVAGAVALLHERFPEMSGQQLQDLLMDSADKDSLVPRLLDAGGDDAWGAGRLNVYRAIYGEAPPEGNRPPRAELVVYKDGDQVTLDASGSADPEGELLWYRFDINYDGVWDTAWSQDAVEVLTLTAAQDQTYTARVQVVDGFGASAGALFVWPDPTVTLPGEDMGGPDLGGDMGGGTADMGDQADMGLGDGKNDGFVDGGGGSEVSSCSAAPTGARGHASLRSWLAWWLRR